VDVGIGNTVTINNTRMLLKGSDVPKMKNNHSKTKEDPSVAAQKEKQKNKSSMSYNGS